MQHIVTQAGISKTCSKYCHMQQAVTHAQLKTEVVPHAASSNKSSANCRILVEKEINRPE
jgi:hypothetical protein